ncbi:TPA: hypothetical protein QFY22_001047 [Staphylococcus aureus]|nr:hypothetical protein [Staphylococcus aureus]
MFLQIGGAPTQRIPKRNSTDNASWRGPNTEADGKSAYNNVQVGERGPNTEADRKTAYNNVQVGGAPTQKLTKVSLQ